MVHASKDREQNKGIVVCMKKKEKSQKDYFYSKTSFILSLGFWVPLFNIGLCIASLILAFKALRYEEKEPERYGGRKYAIAAIVISTTILVFSLIFGITYLYRRISCDTLTNLF